MMCSNTFEQTDLYSMELIKFVTSLAISIPGIVWTIYALLSNFQTYVQLESFSCLLLHILCDCCIFYIEVIITVKKIIYICLNYRNTNQLSSDWFSETKKQ